MRIADNIIDLAGNTPLVRLNKFAPNLIAKLEYYNPANSIKDRVAINMIDAAERSGILTKDSIIIEPSSGNMGIGLAMVCAVKGYKLIIVMHDAISVEYRKILSAYGAKVVLTDGAKGTPEVIRTAYELKEQIANSVILQQFENPNNPQIHEMTTAKEIWSDTDGMVDFIVGGVGSGGTITGLSSLKSLKPSLKIVAVEPARSPVISGGQAGVHKIQGIGSGFVPKNLKIENVDLVVPVSDEDALAMTKNLALAEGLLGSISAGAAGYAAWKIALQNLDKLVVFIVPCSGERQLSAIYD